jgi:hypothetical protein
MHLLDARDTEPSSSHHVRALRPGPPLCVILVAAAVVAVATLSGCWASTPTATPTVTESPTAVPPSPTNTPEPIPTPTRTPPPPTATSTPSATPSRAATATVALTATLRPTVAVPSGYQRYHSDELYVTCIVPSGWSPSVQPTPKGYESKAIYFLPTQEEDCFLGVRISRNTLPDAFQRTGVSDEMLEKVAKDGVVANGDSLLSPPQRTTVAGRRAIFLSYTRENEEFSFTERFLAVWVVGKTHLYYIWLSDAGGCDDHVDPYWRLLLESIEFTEPPGE